MARGLFLLLLTVLARGDTLEDAARALAKNIAARLAPNEIAHVTARNASSLVRGEALRAQSTFEQAIRRRVRNPTTVEVSLTISENLKGYLLIADLRRGEERIVEMMPYRPEPAPAPARPSLTITKKMLWEQEAPILDLALVGDDLLVLDPMSLTRYQRRDGKWIAAETTPLVPATAVVRDPRGRMSVESDSVTIEAPGMTCRGSLQHDVAKPALALNCKTGGPLLSGRNVFDASGRDTTDGPAPFFSEARIGPVRIAAETDGRTRVYDGSGGVSRTIDDWGSDLATFNTCAGPRVAVSGAGDRESRDSVTLYDFVHSVPIRVSDPAEFPGPVTALWPASDGPLPNGATINGAVAVARNLATGKYEAYGLSADCGH